jgi:pimeloyl-ACP methyl ester carboxylesterase
MAAVPPEVFLADFTACDRFEMIGQLPLINLPVLVICGDEDRLTPPKYSSYLQQKLPRAELSVIEGAGHMVMVEKPGETNKAIGRFIQKIAGRADR